MMRGRTFLLLLFVLVACTRMETDPSVCSQTTLILGFAESFPTRAGNPDEMLVEDYNLFIFNSFGDLEEKAFVRGAPVYRTRLLRDASYTILVAANMGYELPIRSLEEARAFRFYLAYPDEYSHGMPMVALLEDVVPAAEQMLPLERLMARIDVSLDRSALEEDAVFKVVGLTVGHCPSSATLFPGSEAEEVFAGGFSKRNGEVDAVNRGGAVSLYTLENCAGGTYVDVAAEFHSAEYHTDPGERIHYRLPLPPLLRNTIYPVVLRINE